MKRFFMIVISICSIHLVFAQSQMHFGLNGGLNFSGFRQTDVYQNPVFGLFSGGFVKFDLNKAGMLSQKSIRTELNYARQGASVKNGYKIVLDYINLPIMLQSTIRRSNFFMEAGPQLGLLVAAHTKYGNEKENINNQMKKTDLSLNLDFGYTSRSGWGTQLRISSGFIGTDKETGNDKNAVISVGIFYMPGKSR